MDPLTLIFFGYSGAGKGTQALMLQKKLEGLGRNVFYVETGERLREFLTRQNFSSELAQKVMAEGGLLPEFLPIWIWAGMFIDKLTGGEDIIMDGLARRLPEAPILDSAMNFYQRPKPDVIFLNVTSGWARARLLGRARYDDTDTNIGKRHVWFEENVKPVVDYFRNHNGYTFHDINGEQTVEEVHTEILAELGIKNTV